MHIRAAAAYRLLHLTKSTTTTRLVASTPSMRYRSMSRTPSVNANSLNEQLGSIPDKNHAAAKHVAGTARSDQRNRDRGEGARGTDGVGSFLSLGLGVSGGITVSFNLAAIAT